MKWNDKNIKMPDRHLELSDRTKDVLVTDGYNFGYGSYNYDSNHGLITS